MPLRDDFVKMVTDYYLKSRDFNGISIRTVCEKLNLTDICVFWRIWPPILV